MKLVEDCAHCFTRGQATPHSGPHLVTPVYGGRASCPLDEADDLEILEELLWVALESALEDAGWDLRLQTELMATMPRAFSAFRQMGGVGFHHHGHHLVWEQRTDEHLEETTGTLDVICTITAPPTLIAA